MPVPKDFSLILFDLGRVLLPFDLRIAARTLEKEYGIFVEDFMTRVMGTEWDDAFEKGKISPQEFHRRVKGIMEVEMPYDRFVSIWNDIFSENRKVSDLFCELKKRFPVAIISNTNILHFEYVYQKFPVVRKADDFILSYREGLRKPDPKMYQRALDRFGALPQQTVYIDDIARFVDASRALGLYGIHFTGHETLKKELICLGLLPS